MSDLINITWYAQEHNALGPCVNGHIWSTKDNEAQDMYNTIQYKVNALDYDCEAYIGL